jgi:hypothetical protein
MGDVLGASASAPARAMWVYKTQELAVSPSAREELLEFCRARDITDLFWQAQFTAGDTSNTVVVASAPVVRQFLREANGRGLRVHALSGDPSHVRPQNYGRVLARVEATVAFNEAGAAAERFAGVHFDIEPHGLPDWKSASLAERCRLLTQLVEVNAAAVERLRSRAPGMLYGADITFWFDKVKEDGSPEYPVTFRGVTKDATKHLLGLVDNVGIMSYRNTAEGRNGIIRLVENTIAHADGGTRGRAFVGVKMADIGPRNETFHGRTEAEMTRALESVEKAYAGHRGFAGLAYFHYAAYREMAAKR